MELNFEEVNNLGNRQNNNANSYNNEQNDIHQTKYWEQPKLEKPKKKRVTFDDILNNMNLVVNQDGVLQYMQPLQQNQEYYEPVSQTHYSSQQPMQYAVNNSEPINPNVKHSYIYNKYFKDYKDNNVQPQGPRKPKSIEELKKMLRDDKIKEIQQKIKLSQIKSKKMIFTNVNGLQMTKNNLRSMSFK